MFTTTLEETKVYQQEMQRRADEERLIKEASLKSNRAKFAGLISLNFKINRGLDSGYYVKA